MPIVAFIFYHHRFLVLEQFFPAWLAQHLRAYHRFFLVELFPFTAELLVLAAEDFILQELAFQFSVVEEHLLGGFQAYFLYALVFIGDDPGRIAHEGMFQAFTEGLVKPQQVGTSYAFAIRRIGNHKSRLLWLHEVGNVLLHEGHIFRHAGSLGIGVGHFDGIYVEVVAIDMVFERAFLAVIIIDFIQKFRVKVGPLLEVVVPAEDTWPDISCNEGGFYGECAASAHGVDEVALSAPSCHQDHASCQYFIQRSFQSLLPIAAAMQRFTR